MSDDEPLLGQHRALFILSFRHRDELAAIAGRAGWQAIAARRTDGLERRFLASRASVAVVDTRGSMAEGLSAISALGDAASANGAALIAVLAHSDIEELGALFDAGATHFLVAPLSEIEFAQTLKFAARYAARLSGEWPVTADEKGLLSWRYPLSSGVVLLNDAVAALVGTDLVVSVGVALRCLDNHDRRTAIAALRRLLTTGQATAFAHDLRGEGRFVQHLRLNSTSNAIESTVERLTAPGERRGNPKPSSADVQDASTARRWLDKRLADGDTSALHVALIALNRFDIVNTAYGRAAGDGLLRIAQRRIEEAAGDVLGDRAIVARMGGSEFVLAADAADARFDVVASRIAESLARPFVAAGTVIVLGSRMGVANAEADDTTAALLRRASEALAEARESDSRTMVFARDRSANAASIDLLAVDLRQAIAAGEIDIVFQPQVTVSTGQIVGVEALARWEHPRLGSLGAETLFAAAERADLVIGLSDHIQRIALDRAAAWPASLATLRLAINLTAADIARPDFADIFIDRVDASGFARSRLTVEITEGGLIDDLGVAAGLLAALRAAGCRVAIDDFGTGYSSLAYLKALPLDYLKIDKKLAQDIAGGARDRIVVRGVIDMARSLGLSVVAEGVETAEQLDLLAKEGCQYYQGFLCAPAMSTTDLAVLVERQLAGRTS
ncbi:MAG: putative bifunctional diguanylate cyclase/phosphodiesterase [Sphingomonas sp.]